MPTPSPVKRQPQSQPVTQATGKTETAVRLADNFAYCAAVRQIASNARADIRSPLASAAIAPAAQATVRPAWEVFAHNAFTTTG